MRSRQLLIVAWLFWFICLVLSAFMVKCAGASEQNFSWLPNTESDLAGYKIHYGPVTGEYTSEVDVGLPATVDGRVHYKMTDLPDDTTYFAATAYDTEDRESDYSAELSANPAPGQVQEFSVTTTTTTTTTTTIAK